MLFTPEIISAFETIINAAENDFEMQRIKVLLKDLTSPPKVEQIDGMHQKFNGVEYFIEKRRNTPSFSYGDISRIDFENKIS